MIGLGIVTTGGVLPRSRAIYVLALMAGVARETGDLAAAYIDGDSTVPAIVTMLTGIAALTHIARTPKNRARQPHAPNQHARS